MKPNRLVVILFLLSYATGVVAQDIAEAKTKYQTIANVAYRGDSDDAQINRMCRLDFVYPADEKGFATIVWFHGGGLTGGHRSVPKALKQSGVAVATVDYRLSPKVEARTCIEDSAAAVAWVCKNVADFGGAPEKIVVSGHSAGGYLTSMLGMDPSYLDAQGMDPGQLAGLAPLSGHTITHFTVRKEMGIDGKQPIIDKMAPLYHVVAESLPPILLVTGDRELEMLGRYEENAYFARMLKVAGHDDVTLHELDGFNHGGMVEPATALVLKFAKRVTGE